MNSTSIAALAIVIGTASGARAQDAAGAIGAAAKAMGADTLNTIEYSASGNDFAFGQAYSPTSPWPRFTVKSYTRAIDFRVPASKADRVRLQAENPPRGGGQQPVRGEQVQSQTIVVGPNTPWVQQLEIWMTPYGFLRAASSRSPTAKSQTTGGRKFTVVSFVAPNKAMVNGYINERNMVERVETWIDNPLFGDTLLDATYTEYEDFNGLKFPTHIVQKQGAYPILDLRVSNVRPNAPVSIQAQAPAPAAAPAAGTPSEKLADGVYLILGGYASLAIDFKDHIVVVEGPQSEERGAAVIAEAKRLIPNKPIRYLVNTHHHVDHSSGLRPFVAEGATIVTHEINKPFFERLFTTPRTVGPNTLVATNAKPRFETVGEKKVMTDGNHVLEIHHMSGNGHNAGLLLVYLPGEKILLEADAYNPPAQANAPVPTPASPYTANLVTTIDRLKLEPDVIIPVHYAADNRKITRAELMRAVGRGTN